jgi:predicted dehydrogenase/threonine dehydrogenase-like Zn-dependent dehydrogenase
MKQVLQHLRSGLIEVADCPAPTMRKGYLLVQTEYSLISPGTERMLVGFARAGWLGKARAQPEKLKQVLNKIRSDGFSPTIETVFTRLDEPLCLGYCNVGIVVAVGDGVRDFKVGQRVVSNGPHAEIVSVPAKLAARLPVTLGAEQACFAILGATALHGIRLLNPTLGETFGVWGLGVVGSLALQLLRLHGADAMGLDPNPERVATMEKMSFLCSHNLQDENLEDLVAKLSDEGSLDGALICAATKDASPINQAIRLCRKKARVISTGSVGLDLDRGPLYQKEITLAVSSAYGPGRYDSDYEEKNQDYPLPYVRWTAGRNIAAFVDLQRQGRVDVQPLISHRFPLAAAQEAYDLLTAEESSLGIILKYDQNSSPRSTSVKLRTSVDTTKTAAPRVRVGMIGAGNFARQILLPALGKTDAKLVAIASLGGSSSLLAARRFEADYCSSDYRQLLADTEINTIFIATPNNSHPQLICDSLAAGKHVFVEKPLAIDEAGIDSVLACYEKTPALQLAVGFNRRFAQHTQSIKKRLQGKRGPLALSMMVNAGRLPDGHWLADPEIGGGRIVGELCHFIDLAVYLVESRLTSIQAEYVGNSNDDLSVIVGFADGSSATINYWTQGSKAYPKERIEVFSAGEIMVIDNWRKLRCYGGKREMSLPWQEQDKGHESGVEQFVRRVTEGGDALISLDDIERVSRATLAALESATNHKRIEFTD